MARVHKTLGSDIGTRARGWGDGPGRGGGTVLYFKKKIDGQNANDSEQSTREKTFLKVAPASLLDHLL